MVYHHLDPRHAVPWQIIPSLQRKRNWIALILFCGREGAAAALSSVDTGDREAITHGHTLTKTLQEITPQQAQTLPTGQLQPFTHIIHYYYHYTAPTTVAITSMTSTIQQSTVLVYWISISPRLGPVHSHCSSTISVIDIYLQQGIVPVLVLHLHLNFSENIMYIAIFYICCLPKP